MSTYNKIIWVVQSLVFFALGREQVVDRQVDQGFVNGPLSPPRLALRVRTQYVYI